MGNFVLGFLVGAAVGAGAAMVLSARPQSEDGLVSSVQSSMRTIIDEAKRATTRREKELWNEFYERVPEAQQPPQS